jgi:DNA-binding transcriptional LysR family regulator
MNIKALRAFRLVVTNGSLAAAADALNLSPPAVSRLISLLEHETQLQLFYRTRRRLTLTPEGEAFYREAEHLLTSFEEIPRIIDDIKGKIRQHFRLIAAPRIGQGLVSPALAIMREQTPELRCLVDIQSRFDLENRVGARRYDIGIVSLPVSHSLIEIENKPLLRVRAEALLAQNHPLAQKQSLTAGDLAPFPMLGLWPNQIWRQQIDDFFRSGGAKPNYVVETRSSLMACQLARDGAGIAILDRVSAEAIDLNGMVMRPIKPERWISFGYIHQHGQPLSAYATQFLDCVGKVVTRLRARDDDYAAAIVPHEQ